MVVTVADHVNKADQVKGQIVNARPTTPQLSVDRYLIANSIGYSEAREI